MNFAFALDSIPRRMKEMGYGENYLTRYRHVRIEKTPVTIIQAHNQLLLFIEPLDNIKIESEKGIYNMLDAKINEQQHEHSGTVTITSSNSADVYILFIQVIPLNKKKK
ncbi:hypothetical protein BH11BAC7_BH11BAC7_21330 [soil metagenome]